MIKVTFREQTDVQTYEKVFENEQKYFIWLNESSNKNLMILQATKMTHEEVLAYKYDNELITSEEIEVYKSILEAYHYSIDEFMMAKIAFQMGYTEVYYNENSPLQDLAIPGEWLTDSVAINDFASDHNILSVSSSKGTMYYLTSEQKQDCLKFITIAENTPVDELLGKQLLLLNRKEAVEQVKELFDKWAEGETLKPEEICLVENVWSDIKSETTSTSTTN